MISWGSMSTHKLSQITSKLKTAKNLCIGEQFRLTWIGGFDLPFDNFVIGVARAGGEQGLLMVNRAPICTSSKIAADVMCEAARSNPNWIGFAFYVRHVVN